MNRAERRNMMSLAELPVTSLARFEPPSEDRTPDLRPALNGDRLTETLEENRIFARILAACYALTLVPAAASLLIPVVDVSPLIFILIPVVMLWYAGPVIWSIFFVVALRGFGKKALWLLPAAPIALSPITFFAGH